MWVKMDMTGTGLYLYLIIHIAWGCPPSWTAAGSSCYKYQGGIRDWTTANEDCIGQGGHLVTIDDDEEEATVISFREGQGILGDTVWVGLTRGPLGTWVWSDGTLSQAWSQIGSLTEPTFGMSLALTWSILVSYTWVPTPGVIPLASICELDTDFNGEWGGWSQWSSCGCQTPRSRVRSCDSPVPLGSGHNCSGPAVQVQSCNMTQCMWQRLGVDQKHKPYPFLISLVTTSEIHCGAKCATHTSCRSFCFKPTEGFCTLLNHSLTPADLVMATGWKTWIQKV